MPADLKNKLAEVEERLSAARDERKQLADAFSAARDAFASTDGYDTDSPEFKAAEEASLALSSKEQEVSALQESQVSILRMSRNENPDPGAPPKPPTEPSGPSAGWDSQALVESEVFKAVSSSPAVQSSGSRVHVGNVHLGQVMTREALAAAIGTGDVAGLVQPDRRGLVPPIFRPLTLLDVIPSGTTNSNLIEYVQATTLPSAAVEVSEGGLKPEADLAFEDASAPIRTIAAWLKANKQVLADAATLQSFIDASLRYDVRRRFENQIIAGSGTGENIEGILHTPGTLAPTVSGSKADRIHNAITAVRLAYLNPGVVLLNPNDWEDIRLSRDDSGASAGTGGYLFGPPSQAGAATVWGLTPVESVVIPEGTAIVLDPRALLALIREGVNVLISDSDQDDFIHNRVTILAEMRGGLLVPRPDGIALADLGS